MTPFHDALRFGGFVLAHAAWIASELNAGELICPIGVIENGDSREIIPFEAATQAEAMQAGINTMYGYIGAVDRWAFAREALWSTGGSGSPKRDVLLVSAWSRGLDEPIILQQCFHPNSSGSFSLFDRVMIAVHEVECTGELHGKILPMVEHGISQHPQAHQWHIWKRE